MTKISAINITAAGTPQPNLGTLLEAVYILMVSPQFSSVKLHSHNHHRSKVAIVGGLLGDIEVLPMVVI